MNIRMMLVAMAIPVMFTGCAGSVSNEPELRPDGFPKILVTDRAYAYIEKHGKGIASMKGMTQDSDLVCENVQLPNKDIRTYCYMRDEMVRRDEDHRDEWRKLTTPGATATN